MDATDEGPYTSVCIRSNKPLVLCTNVVKATLDCLPIIQNLHRLSLKYLIFGRTLCYVGLEDLARSCIFDAYAKVL